MVLIRYYWVTLFQRGESLGTRLTIEQYGTCMIFLLPFLGMISILHLLRLLMYRNSISKNWFKTFHLMIVVLYLSIFLVDCVGPGRKVVAIVNRSRLKLAEKQYSKHNLVFFKECDDQCYYYWFQGGIWWSCHLILQKSFVVVQIQPRQSWFTYFCQCCCFWCACLSVFYSYYIYFLYLYCIILHSLVHFLSLTCMLYFDVCCHGCSFLKTVVHSLCSGCKSDQNSHELLTRTFVVFLGLLT